MKPKPNPKQKIIQLLVKVQILIARTAYQTAFEVCERGIQSLNGWH